MNTIENHGTKQDLENVSGLTPRQQASKILFGDIHWVDREDMADLMDSEFTQDDGIHARNITPNALIAELSTPSQSSGDLRECRGEPDAWLVPWFRANGDAGTNVYVKESDARNAARNLEVYSRSETTADVIPLYASPAPPTDAAPLQEALEAIKSWRHDTLGARPAQSLDNYDEKLRAAFDRGARMAFYRCADRAAAALAASLPTPPALSAKGEG